jgi:pimeloyl-ACP methyl ester carboxylesterase
VIRVPRLRLLAQLVLVFVVAVAARAALDGGGMSEAAIEASGDFAGRVTIDGGRGIYLECRGAGGPTVILISGLRGRGDSWSYTGAGPDPAAVFPQLAGSTRVCVYDRPGTVLGPEAPSRSDPVPMPRTAGDAAAELHALVSAAGLPGPYVLAGSSTGGLIARLFASAYPGEVAGLVMVDAISERVQKAMTRRQWAIYNQRFLVDRDPSLAEYRDLETIDFPLSFAEIRRAGVRPPPSIPFVVISKKRRFGILGKAPPGFSRPLERAWRAGQRYLASLVRRATWVIAQHSGHQIADRQPAIVVGEILGVVSRVRG